MAIHDDDVQKLTEESLPNLINLYLGIDQFNIGSNNLSSAGVSNICLRIKMLKFLDINKNSIGVLPEEISRLSELRELWV